MFISNSERSENNKKKNNFAIAFLLTFAGGFLDAYTYLLFDGIFVNAQTGNLIHLSINLLRGNYKIAGLKFLPILVFCFSIFISKLLIHKFCTNNDKKWVELILLINIFITLLIGIGFFKQNLVATVSVISFVCATMVTTFRTIEGAFTAPTMSTGNLRAFSENFSNAVIHHNKEELKISLRYLCILIIFCLGVVAGIISVNYLNKDAIFLSTIMFLMVLIVVNKKKES